MKRNNTQKGITLVALIITIIVLLILAVVAIRAVQGDGIIAHAKNARDNYNEKQIEENETLEGYIDKIESNIPNGSGTGNVAYTIGQKVMVGTEKFYVIADSDETQDKVTLLAFENIDTTNLVQSASANTIAFSETNYWESVATEYPYHLTEIGELDASHYAAKAAYDYGAKVGGTGRLMAYNEANALKDEYSVMIYGKASANGYLNCWLSSAYNASAVWLVDGDNGDVICNGYRFDNFCGVRPVVEILKSKVSIAT